MSRPTFVMVCSQDALTAVHEYSLAEKIPYKHVLLDSWWYTKGAA